MSCLINSSYTVILQLEITWSHICTFLIITIDRDVISVRPLLTLSLAEADVVVLFLDDGVGPVVEVVRLKRARQGGKILGAIRGSTKHRRKNRTYVGVHK